VNWEKQRVKNFLGKYPDITGQIVLHLYREENELCRIVTLGLNKFCLPEISVKEFPCSDGNTFGNLVNAAAQSFHEDPYLFGDSTFYIKLDNIKNEEVRRHLTIDLKDGATKEGSCHFKYVLPEDGDNPSPQLRILFHGDEESTPEQKAEALVGTIFGATDSIAYAKHDDELLQASENAKRKLPEIKKMFTAGLQPGYSIIVKVPFKINDGNEWMWVEVTEWKTNKMKGILQNDSYSRNDLKVGAVVTFDQADIFDYILNKPDGSYEGNETGKILEKQR